MSTLFHFFALAGLWTSATLCLAADRSTLWYAHPAANWNEALPIGNGRLGAMDFGGVVHERLQLNEANVWVGQAMNRDNPNGYKGFLEARRLLQEGKPIEAEAVANRDMIGVPNRMPQYQTLGDLILDFTVPAAYSEYRHELNLDRALARTVFRMGDSACTRQVIASAPDQVIAISLTCDRPGMLSFTSTLTRPADSKTEALGDDVLRMTGQAIPHDARHADEPKTGVRFVTLLKIVPDGGVISSSGASISVRGATSAILLIAAHTDFRDTDPETAAGRDIAGARKPWDTLLERHIRDYQRFYNRMSIELGPADELGAALPTDERIARVGNGTADLALAALYLNFSRYLLISGSRPGNLAETLQGLWNESLDPPWDSKFTININTEMNYWPAEECNLSDLASPLFDLIDNARGPGRKTAQSLYHAAGFVIHHNTDIWGDAVPIDQARSGMWPMGGAWLSLHLWDHFDYTQDRAFLARRAYPVMKDAAQFFLDYLADDGHGHLVTGPSVSPENRFKLPDGKTASLAMGPYMDTEILRALFTRVIESSEILGLDPDFRARLTAARGKLMPFKIGKYGQLQEWIDDYDESEPGHRHISHLWALYPGDQISPRTTPDLARAARVSLERRLDHGGGSTGWSRAWIVSYWARLLEGELAWKNFQLLLGKSTLPDMLNDGPPFQIDGNFGGAAGLIEMILQSQNREIALLPAIPAAWRSGDVKGLKARGGAEIDLTWRDGRATHATLRPIVDGSQVLRAPPNQAIASVKLAGHAVKFTNRPDGSVSFDADANKSYEIEATAH